MLGHHPPDPNSPKGMAWVLAAGFPDFRPNQPNQQLVLVQGWDLWSQQAWDFGLRWHPELQKKWVKGGGQFSVGEVTDVQPPAEPSLEESAMNMFQEEYPDAWKAWQDADPDQRRQMLAGFAGGIKQLAEMVAMLQSQVEEGSDP